MRAWLAHELGQQYHAAKKVTLDTLDVEEYCKRLARGGDPRPLRALHPSLAEFITAPKLQRGQRYAKIKKHTYAEVAAGLAKCIRSLWLEQYNVRRYRGEKAAEDYAIDILREWCPTNAECAALTMEAVEAAGKPSGKHKPGPRRRMAEDQPV
jgi:hypothetical protein